jgi:hypothetical protein
MSLARLLTKVWIAVCLYAGADALALTLAGSAEPVGAAAALGLCTLLFVAMGLLFCGGFGVLSGPLRLTRPDRIDPTHLVPCFDDGVFLIFAVLSLLDQTFFAPQHMAGPIADALEATVYFAVPGHRAFVGMARPCLFDGGRLFTSAFAWLLALVYFCSALSRIRLAAGLIRLERVRHPEVLGNRPAAFFLGLAAIAGIQLFYVGSAYALLPCSLLTGVAGALIVGFVPLLVAYVVVAALAALVACGDEK